MIGLTLGLFLALEGAYRLQAAIRRRPIPGPAVDSTLHPYHGQAWFHEFNDGPDGLPGRKYHLDPFRFHWPYPQTSRWLNIDSAGRRLTVSSVTDSATALRVFMLGGSAMWGFTARDSQTIPSLLAGRLRARGIDNVIVENLAQAGFTVMQEANTFTLELARGHVPDAAVFLDGYNDMATTFRYGEPGHTYDEDRAEQKIRLGSRGFWSELLGLGRHSQLVQRLLPAPPDQDRAGAEVCPGLAAWYRAIVRETEAVGREFGVSVIFLQQPFHATSRKPRSAWEAGFSRAPAFAACAAAFDSAMADQTGRTYFPAYTLFDQDTATVFVDRHSHITEAAGEVVADTIAGILAPMLRARRATGARPR